MPPAGPLASGCHLIAIILSLSKRGAILALVRAGAVIIPFPRPRRPKFTLSAYAEDETRTERRAARLFASYLGIAVVVLGLLQLLATS